MKHFPFFHVWKPIAVHHYTDTSYGGNAPSTKIVFLCACGKIKTESFYNAGFLTLEDLTVKSERTWKQQDGSIN